MKTLIALAFVFASTTAFSACPTPITIEPGDYQFAGKIFGLKSTDYEYVDGPSTDGEKRVTELKDQGFTCKENRDAWRLCYKIEKYPTLPKDVEDRIRDSLGSPFLGNQFEDLKTSPELIEETEEKCLWKVTQVVRGKNVVGETIAPYYELESYKNVAWTTVTPIINGNYPGPWYRVESSSNLRLVQERNGVGDVKGTDYVFESEFLGK